MWNGAELLGIRFFTTAFRDENTHLEDTVQIECNADGQGYDADDHRDGKFDGYED